MSKFKKGLDNLFDISKDHQELEAMLRIIKKKLSKIDERSHEQEVLLTEIRNKQDRLEENLNLVSNSFGGLLKNPINLELLHLPHSKRRRLLIIGFYGAPNLGDELMLETVLSYLEGRNDLEITVMLCDNPRYDCKKYGPINFIHYPNSRLDCNLLAQYFDVVMFGGGAIIDDTLYDEKDPDLNDLGTLLIEISLRTIAFGKDLLCVGLSANEKLENSEYVKYLKKIIQKARHFSLRDEQSAKIVREICKIQREVEIIEDIVLAHKGLNLKRNKGEVFEVGVNFICNEETEQSFEVVLDSLISFLEKENKNNYIIKLIPFYMYLDNDLNYYEKILKKDKYKERVLIESVPNNMSELLNIFSSKSLVVSMRYHCSLISLVLGIPTLTLELDSHRHYPNKTLYLQNVLKGNKIKISEISQDSVKIALKKTVKESHLTFMDNLLQDAKRSLRKVISYI